jgi:hypothetical protein
VNYPINDNGHADNTELVEDSEFIEEPLDKLGVVCGKSFRLKMS